MSSKPSSAAPSSKETPESILGTFTQERIKQLTDQGIREILLQLYAIIFGIVTALLNAKDPEQKVIAGHLGEVNITLDDAKQLVADGETLIELLIDRDTKAAIAQAATTKLDVARGRMHTEVQSYTGIIRSEIGARSDSLKNFGIKKLGGGRPGPRKNKKNGSGNNSDGSQNKSDGSQNSSEATPNSTKQAAKS